MRVWILAIAIGFASSAVAQTTAAPPGPSGQDQLLKRLEKLEGEVRALRRRSAGGEQQVLVHLTLLEFDRATVRNNIPLQASPESLPGLIRRAVDASQFRVLELDRRELGEQLSRLQSDSIVRVLAEPAAVTVSGRQASVHAGGEIVLPQSPGTGSPAPHLEFGTHFEVTPRVNDDKRIRLDLRAKVVELDHALDAKVGDLLQPGSRTRQLEAAVELKAGQTLVLGGSANQCHSGLEPSVAKKTERVEAEKTTLWFISAETDSSDESPGLKAAKGQYIDSVY